MLTCKLFYVNVLNNFKQTAVADLAPRVKKGLSIILTYENSWRDCCCAGNIIPADENTAVLGVGCRLESLPALAQPVAGLAVAGLAHLVGATHLLLQPNLTH